MKYFIPALLFFFAGCASTKLPPLPPGVTIGQKWGEQYGYEDVYSTPEVLPSPKRRGLNLMKKLNDALVKVPCKQRTRLTLRLIIDEKGDIAEILPYKPNGEACETAAANALKDIKFFPAQYQGENVKAIISMSAYM